MLLVLLHDFPEFLCDYHYGFCDVIPPNCIQLRNLILSAFPRNMRLPDPFTPNLKVKFQKVRWEKGNYILLIVLALEVGIRPIACWVAPHFTGTVVWVLSFYVFPTLPSQMFLKVASMTCMLLGVFSKTRAFGERVIWFWSPCPGRGHTHTISDSS